MVNADLIASPVFIDDLVFKIVMDFEGSFVCHFDRPL